MVLDYDKIGLKVGLEIHQQLDTNKLFCSCPSDIRDDSPDRTIKRVLRASAGETGDMDVAAKAEMEKQKYFVYEYYEDSNCLVELDEEPPNPINTDALDVVMQVTKMTNAHVVDEIHVMRKTVVDGSNTSGFQRTALVATDGKMDVGLSDGRTLAVAVDTLCIEEDAARIMSKNPDFDIYRLDRLGIPLIEMATGPDMRSPQDVKEVAGFIGMLLRSTGKAKRGLGTIRQDVNVSISGGARVEIKGVQDLRLLDKVVENEAIRQLNMIKLREIMKDRGVKVSNDNPIDYSDAFKDTQSKFIRKGLDDGQKIFGKSYKNFKGLFGYEINPNRRFGSEMSDRIKILGLNGLIHTDEDLEKYKIVEEVRDIYGDSNKLAEDSMILILGSEDKCILAFKKVDDAMKEFIANGLAKEVRNAKEDATSVFLRPMPGSSRMYPETDVPSFVANLEHIQVPELVKDKIIRFEKEYGLPKQVAKDIVWHEGFEYYVKIFPQIRPITIAEALDSMLKDIKTRYGKDFTVYKEQYDQIFTKLNSGDISKEAIPEILLGIAEGRQGTEIDFSSFQSNEDEITSYIVKVIAEHPNHTEAAVMGEVMKKYRGKFPGQKIMELIKKFKGG
jgi:glutamyl-tRNA(Gln) amidotransferase subunit E